MARTTLRRSSFAPLGALLLVVALTCCWQQWTRRSLHDPLVQQYERSFSRAETLCRAIAPQGDLYLTPELLTDLGDGHRANHVWSIECKDSQGRMVAHIFWDAETDGYSLVPNSYPDSKIDSRREMRAGDVVIKGKNWLTALGLTHDSPLAAWKLTDAPQRISSMWQVCFQQEGQRVMLQMTAVSGRLVRVWVSSPDSKTAPRHAL